MTKEPTLIIMAAGMGSRFGGLKQIEEITDAGEIIVDFSLYDALLAGFKRAVFIIKEENEKDFRKLIDKRAGKHMEVHYAFQKIDDLPEGYAVPRGREKPWGTAHAVMSAKHLIDGPFAVINADDFYGPEGFRKIYDFLAETEDDEKYRYCMVGFQLSKTVTENGHVSRGVCELDNLGYLKKIVERTKIKRVGETICYEKENGDEWVPLSEDDTVSMNFWGFTKSLMNEMKKGFPDFLDDAIVNNPLKGEYMLPSIADKLLQNGKATVKVLNTSDQWYGITYRGDKESVTSAIQSMKDKGLYPDRLWKSVM